MMIAILALVLQAGHDFQPVDPAWRLMEDTLERRNDSFVVVKQEERRSRDYWREKRYSEDGRERKILRYDPQGRLRLEVDSVESDRFTRVLRADGSLACYQHHRHQRFIEAFSISPDGRTVHHVQDGIGDLVTEGEDGAWQHLRLLPGITVARDYRGEECRRISIWIGSDHFLWTPDVEELSLHAPAEHWSVRGQTVDVQIVDLELVDGKIRRRAREASPDVRPLGESIHITPGVISSIRAEWTAAWPKRRAAFMTRVEDALNAAEEDWGRLGLEFVRDGASRPK